MTKNFAMLPVIVLLTLLTAPIIIMYVYLVLDTFSNTPPGALFPTSFTLEHWRFLVDPSIAGNVWIPTLNSLIFASCCTVIVLTISSTGGYALSRLNMPFRSFFLGGLMVLHAFPAVTLLIGIFLILNFSGLYNTLTGIVLVKAALTLPLGVWIMKGFYDAVPWEIEMAGVQDGASRFTVWRRLVLPQIRPGFVALGAFAFLEGWGEYLLPRVLAPSADFRVLSVFLATLSGPDTANYDFSLFQAVGLFYTLPVLLLFLIFQNRLMNIFNGGTKG